MLTPVSSIHPLYISQSDLKMQIIERIERLLCARHCVKLFTYKISFNPHKKPVIVNFQITKWAQRV